MPTDDPTRRRSPGWVRQWSLRDLHAVALRLNHERTQHDLSARQERFWDGLVSELEYRRRYGVRNGLRNVCHCELCFAPFDEYEDAPWS